MRARVICFLCIVMVGLMNLSVTVWAQTDITEMLKNIEPGTANTYPMELTDVGGMLYFKADDGFHGEELWRSDGTPYGTVMVKDIYPGASSASPEYLAAVGDVVYFRANDGTNGVELWKSDGTPSGTVMVKDIYPGALHSNPINLTAVGDVVYFRANDGTNGVELWKSDGTPGGTLMVKDIYPGPSSSNPIDLTDVGGILYFGANDGTNGYELWKSDGTPGGTVIVKDINPGASWSSAQHLADIGGVLYFEADDGTNGMELWKSDGIPSGTVMVKDIYPGGGSSSPNFLTNVGGVLYFRAIDGTNGAELWKSDGTPSGTVMVKDINPGPSSSSPDCLTDVGGVLYLTAYDFIHGAELWKSDGTPGGTMMVKDIWFGVSSSYPQSLTNVSGVLYFVPVDDGTNGHELWKSDGTPSGTVLVKDINPGPSSSYPLWLTNVSGALYFRANDGTNGFELWKNYTQDQVGKILSVRDISGDQGGQVHLKWQKSVWDAVTGGGHVLSYGIWRMVSSPATSQVVVKAFPPEEIAMLVDSLSDYYYLMEVPAVGIPTYNVVVPTLSDSSSGGTPYSTFIITAHTTDIHYYYISQPDSGYSVDNLSPIPPAGLLASVVAGPQVELSWNSPKDPDVGHYNVYRSGTSGFTPDDGNKIGTSNSTSYTDGSPISGSPSYYKIIAVDIHDNVSEPSNEAEAAVTINKQFSVSGKWNIVSVPLTMSDYTKTVLFPSASTNAYTFEDGYVAYGILQNGIGYWMKFSSGETISHDGLERTEDTITVTEGWNMVGSLSSSIIVSSVGSIPGGIMTSPFYKYDNGYTPSSTIEPGHGYWVKVLQAGQLVMSTTSTAPANRIKIQDTGELPPPPPDEVSSVLPDAYSLEQNYPNPFNPLTSINYALPTSEHVRLCVFNMLGQEMVVLVDEVQDAGFKTVAFDASNLPSGVYTYRFTAGTFTDTKKMLLLK